MPVVLFLKAHVKGYTRKDGSVVKTHETKVQAAHKPVALGKKPVTAQWPGWDSKKPLVIGASVAPAQDSLFPSEPVAASWPFKSGGAKSKKWGGSAQASMFGGASFQKKPSYPSAVDHPQPGLNGKPFQINVPSVPSMEHTWSDPDAAAMFVPGGETPEALNGVAFAPWADAPTSMDQWQDVDGQIDLDEPDLMTHGKAAAAGVVIEEPDGRIWLVNPTNGFGGYTTTFPKGHADDGLSLQATAIKEAFEESGLQIEITGLIGDIVRSTTVARYYRARRVGGTPAAMGWEVQAVQLVPQSALHAAVNQPVDRSVASLAGIDAPRLNMR